MINESKIYKNELNNCNYSFSNISKYAIDRLYSLMAGAMSINHMSEAKTLGNWNFLQSEPKRISLLMCLFGAKNSRARDASALCARI